jgi:8-oxo-dGTP diphosphatase
MSVSYSHRGDGDGWVHCACGRRHWGRYGAAGLLLYDEDRGVLLQRRASWSHYGGTWGVPGGALDSDESARDGALREAQEEAGVAPDAVTPTAESVLDHGSWHYVTVLATATGPVRAEVSDWESAELRWVPVDEVAELPLLPAFASAWPALRGELDRQVVLVVDAANVMGSRPDGWWRDRAGAAERLRDALAEIAAVGLTSDQIGVEPHKVASEAVEWRWWPRIVLVVEGKARGVEPVDGVEVVAATRDGDSAIVEVAHEVATGNATVLVATSDRELRRRVRAVGAEIFSPGALLALLGQ